MTTLSRASAAVSRLVLGLGLLAFVDPALSGGVRATQQSRQPQPDQVLASVVGQVVDGVTARPIPNASVSVYGVPVFDVSPNREPGGFLPVWAAPSCSTRSDSEGWFTCRGLEPFAYMVHVRKDWASGELGQRSPSSAGRVLTLTDQRPQTVRVPLWRDPIVSGRVLDPDGEPLIGMEVVAIPAAALTSRSTPDERRFQRRATTDDRGAYVLPVSPGDHVLAAMPGVTDPPRTEVAGRPAIYPLTFSGDVRDAGLAHRLGLTAGTVRDDVNITVQPVTAFRVTGIVSAPTSAIGARVELVRADGARNLSQEPEIRHTTTVDTAGRFTLPDVPSDEYRLRVLRAPWMPLGSHGNPPLASLPDEPTLWADVPIVVSETDLDLDITLRRGVGLSGRVVFEGSETPPRADIQRATFTLMPTDGWQLDVRGLLLSEATFATIEIVPGRYVLRPPFFRGFHIRSVTRGDRSILNEPIDVGASAITDVVMTYGREPTTLAGRVTRPSSLGDVRGSVTMVPVDSDAWHDLGREALMQTVLIGMPGTYDVALVPGDYLVMATDLPVPATRAGLAEMEARATRVTVSPGGATRLDLQLSEMSP